jgi:SPP1 family predicted phage head-tail adaptor
MSLNPGDLNRRVSLWHAAKVDDGKGASRVTWEIFATVFAEVIGQNGREAVIAQALQGVSSYRIRIRFRTDVSAGDQVRYGTIDLNIKSVSDPDGAREQLLILADTSSVQRMD